MNLIKLRFSKTIKHSIDSEQLNTFLEYLEEILQERRVNNLVRNDFGYSFKNHFFKLENNWRLMAMIDSGYIQLEQLEKNSFKIVYGITVIKNLLVGLGFITIFVLLTKFPFGILLLGLILIQWIFNILRHWLFLLEIAFHLKEILDTNK